MLDQVASVCQVVVSGLAIWLLNGSPRQARCGAWVGLVGQLAWYWASIRGHAWGTLGATVIYTVAYLRGILRGRTARANSEPLIHIPTRVKMQI